MYKSILSSCLHVPFGLLLIPWIQLVLSICTRVRGHPLGTWAICQWVHLQRTLFSSHQPSTAKKDLFCVGTHSCCEPMEAQACSIQKSRSQLSPSATGSYILPSALSRKFPVLWIVEVYINNLSIAGPFKVSLLGFWTSWRSLQVPATKRRLSLDYSGGAACISWYKHGDLEGSLRPWLLSEPQSRCPLGPTIPSTLSIWPGSQDWT